MDKVEGISWFATPIGRPLMHYIGTILGYVGP